MKTKYFRDIAEKKQNEYQIVWTTTWHGWQPISKWKDKPEKASLDPLSQATLRSIHLPLSVAKLNLNKHPAATSF